MEPARTRRRGKLGLPAVVAYGAASLIWGTVALGEGAVAPLLGLCAAFILGLTVSRWWILFAAGLPIGVAVVSGSDLNEVPGFYLPVFVGIVAAIATGAVLARLINRG